MHYINIYLFIIIIIIIIFCHYFYALIIELLLGFHSLRFGSQKGPVKFSCGSSLDGLRQVCISQNNSWVIFCEAKFSNLSLSLLVCYNTHSLVVHCVEQQWSYLKVMTSVPTVVKLFLYAYVGLFL